MVGGEAGNTISKLCAGQATKNVQVEFSGEPLVALPPRLNGRHAPPSSIALSTKVRWLRIAVKKPELHSVFQFVFKIC